MQDLTLNLNILTLGQGQPGANFKTIFVGPTPLPNGPYALPMLETIVPGYGFKMMSRLMRVLGKLEQMGLMLLRWAAVVLLGGVALVIAAPFVLYFWDDLRFNATTAESDARSS